MVTAALDPRLTRATWTCRTCRTEVEAVSPDGWYQIRRRGDHTVGSDDIRSGYFCTASCLLVSVLGSYGLTPQQVTAWLATSSD